MILYDAARGKQVHNTTMVSKKKCNYLSERGGDSVFML